MFVNTVLNMSCLTKNIARETDIPAFIWDGAKLVPSDPRTLARRQEDICKVNSSSHKIQCEPSIACKIAKFNIGIS